MYHNNNIINIMTTNKDKILFLDIDGVLVNYKCNSLDNFGMTFDNECVSNLKHIIDKTKCKIVLSSSLRSKGSKFINTMWATRKMPGFIIDFTPKYASETTINLHASNSKIDCRGYEIQEWIDKNKPYKYCILDDDNDMLPNQYKNFVNTNFNDGLTYELSNKVIEILNS